MSLSPLDAPKGTGPLPALGAVLSLVSAAAEAVDSAIAKLDRPRGAGTKMLQGYDDDPFLVMPNDEGAADGTTGQLVMQWQPPSEEEAWDELQKAKDQTAEAAQERVILGATGQPVRVVGV